MKAKKIPLRTCVISKEKLPKAELLRIVRTTDGNVVVDLTGKLNGRGAYIKKDIAILEKARKTKTLERHLECNINEDVYEEIKNIINK